MGFTCICCRFPAVILDIVQQASFLIVSLDELNNGSSQFNTWQFKTTWVCVSSPVTILPTARKDAWTTFNELCLNWYSVWLKSQHQGRCAKMIYTKSSTSRLQTPASITFCIFSFGPSDKYDRAQHASANTSLSWLYNKLESTGKAASTLKELALIVHTCNWNTLFVQNSLWQIRLVGFCLCTNSTDTIQHFVSLWAGIVWIKSFWKTRGWKHNAWIKDVSYFDRSVFIDSKFLSTKSET